jgi:hypothetical protein
MIKWLTVDLHARTWNFELNRGSAMSPSTQACANLLESSAPEPHSK